MKIKPIILSLSLAVLSSIMFLSLTCKDEPTTPTDYDTFNVEAQDASCTEVFLKVHLTAGFLPRTVQITRDTIIVINRTMTETDNILIDTNLTPNHTYTYKAQLLNGTEVIAEITQFTAQTMDTTSHNFTWTTYTLGDGTGNNVLNDVAFINDTCIWVVGEIHRNDTVFNAAKWNGYTWNLQRLLFQGFPPVIHSVFAINDHDMWLDPWFHWNGQSYQELSIDPVFIGVGINKMWGNANDLYVIGDNGFIAHFNGSSWTKMESGTTVDLTDVYGTPDGKEVWACGWNESGGGVIIKQVGNSWQKVWDRQTSTSSIYRGKINSLWATNNTEYVFTGTGDVFRQSLLIDGFVRQDQIDLGHFAYAIRGSARNDITLAGDGGTVWHFNGKTWSNYSNLYNIDHRLYSLAVSSSKVIIVGEAYNTFPTTALVIVGSR